MKSSGAPRRSCSPCRKLKLGCSITPGNQKCDRCTSTNKPCHIAGQDFVTWAQIHLQKPPTTPNTVTSPTSTWLTQATNSKPQNASSPAVHPHIDALVTYTGPLPRLERIQELNASIPRQTDRQFLSTYQSNLRKLASTMTSLNIPLTTLSWLITDNFFTHHHLIIPLMTRSWTTSSPPSLQPVDNPSPLWMTQPILTAGILLGCINPLTGTTFHPGLTLDKATVESLFEIHALTIHHILTSALQDNQEEPLVPLSLLLEAMASRQVSGAYWSRRRGVVICGVSVSLAAQLFYKYKFVHLDKYDGYSSYPNRYLRELWQPNMAVPREIIRRIFLSMCAYDWVLASTLETGTFLSSRDIAGFLPPMPEHVWINPPSRYVGYDLDGRIMPNLEWMFLPRDDPIRWAGLKAVADIMTNECNLLGHFTFVLVSMTLEATFPKDDVLQVGTPPFPADQAKKMAWYLVKDFVESLPEPLKTMYKQDDISGLRNHLALHYSEEMVVRLFISLMRIPDVQCRLMVVSPIGSAQREWMGIRTLLRNFTMTSMNLPHPPPLVHQPIVETEWFTIVPEFSLEQVLTMCISTATWAREMAKLTHAQYGWGPYMLILRTALIFISISRLLDDGGLKKTTMEDAMDMFKVLAEMTIFQKKDMPGTQTGDFQEWAPNWIKQLVGFLQSPSRQPLTVTEVASLVSERFRDEFER